MHCHRRFLLRSLAFLAILPSWLAADSLPALAPTHADVVYGEAGSQRQLLDIFYPNGRKPAVPSPTIVCIHGGAWRGGNKKDMALVTVPLTKADFVCVSVGYRLFDPVRHQDNVWPTQIDDCQRAVRFLRANAEKYGIDPSRIGAIGFSAGGHLVSLLGTTDTRDNNDAALSKFSSRVQCVVNVFGPSDLTMDYSHLKYSGGSVQDLVEDFMGRGRAPEVLAKYKKDASPLLHVNAQTVPHSIFHGAKDPIVPVENSRKLTAALKEAKIPVEYTEYPNEGHGISPPNLGNFVEKFTAFFKMHLAKSKVD